MPKAIRRTPQSRLASLLVFVVLVVVAILASRLRDEESGPGNSPAPPPPEGEYEVVRVVDGDTIKVRPLAPVDGERPEERVRLLGIDTPESVKPDSPVEPWGPEASEFTREFLAGGRVRLVFDRRTRDDYGRLLAYVYVGETMLNEELVRAGLAEAKGYSGDAQNMQRRLERAEDEARRARRGIWSQTVPQH